MPCEAVRCDTVAPRLVEFRHCVLNNLRRLLRVFAARGNWCGCRGNSVITSGWHQLISGTTKCKNPAILVLWALLYFFNRRFCALTLRLNFEASEIRHFCPPTRSIWLPPTDLGLMLPGFLSFFLSYLYWRNSDVCKHAVPKFGSLLAGTIFTCIFPFCTLVIRLCELSVIKKKKKLF